MRTKWWKIILVLITSLLIGGFFLISNVTLEVDTGDMTINLGDEYEIPEAKAYTLGIDLGKYLTIDNNINKDKVGEYAINYHLFDDFRTASIKVKVVDTVPPVLNLKQGNVIKLKKGEEFVDPGYEAYDNSGNEVKVTVSYDDLKDEGISFVSYKAEDESGNRTIKCLDVVIEEEELDLYEHAGYHKKNLTYEQFDEYSFIGDSNIREMGFNFNLDPKRVVAAPALTPQEYFYRMCTYKNEEFTTIPTYFVEMEQPKVIVFHVGIYNCEIGGLQTFIDAYEEMIKDCMEKSPGVKIYLSAILPVVQVEYSTKPANRCIDIYNDQIARLADRMGVYYMGVDYAFKLDNGEADPQYYQEDGYHLNEEGRELFVNYYRFHYFDD